MRRGTGAWFDGSSAGRHEVVVRLTPEGLRILQLPGESELAFWALRDLRPVDEASPDGPRRIRNSSSDALLVLDDPSMFAAIASRAPALSSRARTWTALSLRWAGLLAVSFVVLLAVFWLVVPRFAEQATRLVAPKWEERFGDELVVPVVRQLAWLEGTDSAEFCTAPRGREVLEALTRRLSPPEWPHDVHVRVVNLEMVNAFALPGGQILLSEGLLRYARSPDEVVGIIAHEMGHVLHRHATTAMIEALGVGFLFGVMLGDLGFSAVGMAGEALVRLSFSREAESEADQSAADLLRRAGLGTGGLVDFFERMDEDVGDVPAHLAFLSTHPRNESRIRRFHRGPGAIRPSLETAEWRSLRRVCSQREPLVAG